MEFKKACGMKTILLFRKLMMAKRQKRNEHKSRMRVSVCVQIVDNLITVKLECSTGAQLKACGMVAGRFATHTFASFLTETLCSSFLLHFIYFLANAQRQTATTMNIILEVMSIVGDYVCKCVRMCVWERVLVRECACFSSTTHLCQQPPQGITSARALVAAGSA